MIKMIPKTSYNQYREPKRMHGELTIKLNRIMRHGLDKAPTGPFPLNVARFASFAVHVEHKSHRRNTASHKDDDKGSKCPTPAGAFVEQFNKLRSGEGRSDPRCLIEAENDHAVFERGDISAHDIGNVDKANMTGPVKNVATDIRLNICADSLDDHTEDTDQEHHAETLDTAPEIDDFRHGKRNAATKCCRDNGAHGEQAVGPEIRCNVWVETRVDVVLQQVHKVDQI